MLPFGLIVAMTILPLVVVEDAPEVGKDADFSEFLDLKRSDVYRERLNGILGDYIEWGIL